MFYDKIILHLTQLLYQGIVQLFLVESGDFAPEHQIIEKLRGSKRCDVIMMSIMLSIKLWWGKNSYDMTKMLGTAANKPKPTSI